jgi:hypothetical protein
MAARRVAAALLVLAGAAAGASPAAATAALPTKTLTVRITSGPEGTVTTPTVSFSFIAEGTAEPGTIFECGETALTVSACTSPHAEGPLASGMHTFYVKAYNAAANTESPFASRTFTIVPAAVAPAGGGAGSSAPPVKSQPLPGPLAPVLSSVAQSAPRWREGSSLARIAAQPRPPRGTTFSFTLSEAALAHLTFTQALSGRSVAGRCVAQTRANRTKRSCRRTKSAGTLTLKAPAGADHVRFEGRLSSARRLKPGRYTVALSATAAGLTSAPRSLSFTIVS